MKKQIIYIMAIMIGSSIMVSCKKDVSPTKTNIKIGHIYLSTNSDYTFTYEPNNQLIFIRQLGYLFANNTCTPGTNEHPYELSLSTYPDRITLDNYKNVGDGGSFPSKSLDQHFFININNTISKIFGSVYDSPLGGTCLAGGFMKFKYDNSNLTSIIFDKTTGAPNFIDTIKDFEFTGKNLTAFKYGGMRKTEFQLGYQNSMPDTSVINVNGINNIILSNPFDVQAVLPILAIDSRFSLTGKRMENLINSYTFTEPNNGNPITTTWLVNYLYDVEGHITRINFLDSQTAVVQRYVQIDYL